MHVVFSSGTQVGNGYFEMAQFPRLAGSTFWIRKGEEWVVSDDGWLEGEGGYENNGAGEGQRSSARSGIALNVSASPKVCALSQ